MTNFQVEINHPLVKMIRPWFRRHYLEFNSISDIVGVEDKIYKEYCDKYDEDFPLLRGLLTEIFLLYILKVYGHTKTLGHLKEVIPIYEWDPELDYCGIDYIGINTDNKYVVINGKRGGGFRACPEWTWKKKDKSGRNMDSLVGAGICCFGDKFKEAYHLTLASDTRRDSNLEKMINMPHQKCRIVGYETLQEIINFDDRTVCQELAEGFKWSIENSVPCDEYENIKPEDYQKGAKEEMKKEADQNVAALLISGTGSGKTIVDRMLLEKETNV